MSTTTAVSEIASQLGDTLKSICKIILQSRRTIAPTKASASTAIILANGPSLRQTIAEHSDKLLATPTVAVNFMANAPEFAQLKPQYYVLADPHFFTGTDHENVAQLWQNLSKVDWDMCLSVPAGRLSIARELLHSNKVAISTFNFVGGEGFPSFERWAYSHGLAMPRPRNVLIPAIMTAIAAGFSEIYLTGADHSWLETIRVNEHNEVVSVQPHFYTDSKKETQRSVAEYRGYHLHDILKSFYIAFSSYHRLLRYTERARINIYNSTPGSFIDAFPRKEL